MKPLEKIERLVKKFSVDANAKRNELVLNELLEAQARSKKSKLSAPQLHTQRITMKGRIVKLAVAAMIIITFLGGIHFWPWDGSGNGKWWLGPPAAWGQEIIEALQRVEALAYRGQGVFVGRFGRTHVSGTWSRSYEAADRFRKDTYYEHTDEDTYGHNKADSVLQNTIWWLPDGADLIKHEVSFEFQCYTIKKIEDGAYENDPVEKLKFYVNLIDKADRIIDTKIFDGQECIGFEISASKYGNNPAEWIDRV